MADRIHLPPMALAVDGDAVVRTRGSRRVRLVGGAMLALLALVGLRGAQLAVWPHERTRLEAAVQRWDTHMREAPRGQILDRLGHRLAVSRSTAHVICDPKSIPAEQIPHLAQELVAALGGDPAEYRTRLGWRPRRYVVLANNAHPKQARLAASLHPAIYLEEPPERFYPEGPLAAHVLGFVNAEGTGREGLEATFESYLKGGVILRQWRRDRQGTSVDDPVQRASFHAGMNVHLTLDRTIQAIAEDVLDEVVERSAPTSAMAVVVDVASGDVLAMANRPTFDPNRVGRTAQARRNRAIEHSLELGSVLKPLTVAAALHHEVVAPTTLVDCGGPLVLQNKVISDTHPLGACSLRQLLTHSSNIGASRLGLSLGSSRLVGFFRSAGLGTRTGLGLPAESAGILRDELSPLGVANVAFGQGIAVTPLQLALAMAALGNEGRLMRPRLVKRIVDVHGVPEHVNAPQMARRLVSAETARHVLDWMVGVTEDPGATGHDARPTGFHMAGKSGTAQKIDPDTRAYGDGRVATFTAVVPASEPRLSIVVVIDEPTKGSHAGGPAAGPAVRDIATASLQYLGFGLSGEPRQTLAMAEVLPSSSAASLAWVGDGWRVPDLTGQLSRDILRLLHAAELSVSFDGHGRAVAQQPPPGHVVSAGGRVAVTLR